MNNPPNPPRSTAAALPGRRGHRKHLRAQAHAPSTCPAWSRDADLSNNLYRLWNRLSSGSYIPPPMRRVEIPKSDGGKRPLGIPMAADRVAQAVVKMQLEPLVEPHFDVDSYGYRPKKSAIQAVGVARQRCFRYHPVVDVDIRGFFDHLDHELLMRAVRKHTDCNWVLPYIDRWLKAPLQLEDGKSVNTTGEIDSLGAVLRPWADSLAAARDSGDQVTLERLLSEGRPAPLGLGPLLDRKP